MSCRGLFAIVIYYISFGRVSSVLCFVVYTIHHVERFYINSSAWGTVLKAIDRLHFFALEKAQSKIEKDKSSGSLKRIYLIELDCRYEFRPDDVLLMSQFYDSYGVWFGGALGAAVVRRCGFAHVFLSAKIDKLGDGVYDVSVYGVPSRLTLWHAQGYTRGVVIACEDDAIVHETVNDLAQSKPWCFSGIFGTIRQVPVITLQPHFPQPEVLIGSGKYAGKTVSEIAVSDHGYIRWLAENAKEQTIRETAAKFCRGVGNASV